jgi:hypothetical protein
MRDRKDPNVGGRPPVIPESTITQVRRLDAMGWAFRRIGRHLNISHTHVARVVRGDARTEVQP